MTVSLVQELARFQELFKDKMNSFSGLILHLKKAHQNDCVLQ